MTPPADPQLQELRPAPEPVEGSPANDPVRPGRKRRLVIAAAVVSALAVLAFAVHAFLTRGDQGTDDAQIDADVVALSARVGGPIAEVLVQDNAPVKKDQVVARIDDADYQARARQADAELATARAQADAADAQVQIVEASARGGLASARATVQASSAAVTGAAAQVEAARAALRRAEAEAQKAANDLDRAKQLRAADAIAQDRLDAAQAANDTAQAGLAAARAQIAAAEEGRRGAEGRVGEARGRLDQSTPIAAQIAAAHASAALAHARVKSAEAAADLARLQLAYTQIRAPADGFISKLGARVGQMASPGQILAQLVPDETYVTANFKETQLGDVRPGQAADVEIDAYSGKTLHGRVVSISGGTGARFALLPPDNASGNFVKVVERVPVRIAWVNPPKDLPLRAGMSAFVTVHTR